METGRMELDTQRSDLISEWAHEQAMRPGLLETGALIAKPCGTDGRHQLVRLTLREKLTGPPVYRDPPADMVEAVQRFQAGDCDPYA